MPRTRLGFLGPAAAYPGFAPKIETILAPIGAVSADGVIAYLGGAVSAPFLSSLATVASLGGTVTAPTLGGSIE
jgi:hypothetical protein